LEEVSMSYQATLKSGAKAYSLTGVEWGNAIADGNGQITVVSSIQIDKGNFEVVDVPRWSNGKRWAIKPEYVVRLPDNGGGEDPGTPPDEEPPPIPPTGDPDEITQVLYTEIGVVTAAGNVKVIRTEPVQ